VDESPALVVFAESLAAVFKGVWDEMVKRVSKVSREYKSRKNERTVITKSAYCKTLPGIEFEAVMMKRTS
jgi:hypothetical protein